jgi:hypothetical protein
MVPGTVAFPAETQPGKAEKTVESKVTGSPEPAETAEAVSQQSKPPMPEKAVETAEPVSVRQTVYSGILERFQAYQGEKTPANMIDLFTKAVSTSIHQNPSVAISDGTTTVRVVVDHSAVTGTSTNFALSGAKLVSLKNDVDSGVWVLEILPSANALQATVTIVNSNSITTFPLTVVPPIGTASVSRADFDAFIKDGGSRVPKYDLNGDGSHNYQDDYIYTAHYLIAQSTAATTAK